MVKEYNARGGLNRTMQYGNRSLTEVLNRVLLCLNRTMQYGNDFFVRKSVYIVCRLNRTMQYGNWVFFSDFVHEINLFKSYYVVWKRYTCEKSSTYSDCLNRTMQYGNDIKRRATSMVKWFKSYYVVWKPENKYISGGSCYV